MIIITLPATAQTARNGAITPTMQENRIVQIKRLRWNADKTPMEGTVIASSIMGCTIRIDGRVVEFNRIGISTCGRYQLIEPINFTHG